MTYVPAVFPDIEVVLVAYLKTLTYFVNSTVNVNQVSTLIPAGTDVFQPAGLATVGTDLPVDYNGTQFVCRINRIAGPTEWPKADHPVVEVDCWGPDKPSAAALRDAVRLSLTWMVMAEVDFSAYGARISNPVEHLGPEWFPEDGYESAGRWRFEISLDLRNG